MGDRVEGRGDPAVSHVQPGASRRHGCREQGKAEPATVRSRRHPWGPRAHEELGSTIGRVRPNHGLVPLSIASRLALNSLSGFHSG